MKVNHQTLEQMLATKGVTKKAYATYAQIPYFTVAGWKKSDSVPAYAMVLLKNMPFSQTVTAKQLIDAGLPRAIFWNNDLFKPVPRSLSDSPSLNTNFAIIDINKKQFNRYKNFYGKSLYQLEQETSLSPATQYR